MCGDRANKYLVNFWWQTRRQSQKRLEPKRSFVWVSGKSSAKEVTANEAKAEFDADVVPFQPRFLLQEIIFAHCPSRASEEISCAERMAFSKRDCGLRVYYSPGPRDCHLLRGAPVRKNDEFDAVAVRFQPRFLLQELIFAHRLHQPRSSIRGKFLNKADRLSLSEESQAPSATPCRSGY